MINYEEIEKVFADAAAVHGAYFGWSDFTDANFGTGKDNTTLLAPEAKYPRSVWVYETVSGEIRPAYTVVLPDSIPYEDNPALVNRAVVVAKPANSSVPHIYSEGNLATLAATGGYTYQELKVHAVTYPPSSNLLDFRLAAEDPDKLNFPSRKHVYVNPGWYYTASGILKRFGGDYYDLDTQIAALTSGQHQMVLICVDTATGSLVAVTNSATTGTQKELFDENTIEAMTVNSAYQPSGAAHVYYDQTHVGEADLYRTIDPRPIFATSGVYGARIIPLTHGGTNADLSATGPGALVQATLGANVSLLAPGTARNVMISTGSAWESRALVVADIPSGIDHGGLAGLADDDHTQYVLLTGRAGGQTLKGGTALGDSLILSSTNHATKGDLTVAGFAVFKETPNQLVLTAGSKIMPASNTTTALNIANAAGTSFFIFDSTNLRARVQSGSDYIEFDPAGTTYQLTVFNSGVFDAKLGVSNSGWLTNTNVLVSGYAQASITSSGGTAITGVFKNSAASASNNAVAIVLLPYSSAGQSDGAQIRAFEANSTTGATDLILMTDPASTGAVERLRISSIGVITQTVLDSGTTSVTDILSLKHNSSGTPGAGYGSGLLLPGKSSTTDDRSMARIRTIWTTATDASRKARLIFSAYDTAERDVISIEASGSAGMLAFFGGTPVVKATALTAALTTLTFTAPGTPDYAIAAPIDSAVGSAFGFSTADEFNTHLSVIANLQVRVNEVESKLQAYSLIA